MRHLLYLKGTTDATRKRKKYIFTKAFQDIFSLFKTIKKFLFINYLFLLSFLHLFFHWVIELATKQFSFRNKAAVKKVINQFEFFGLINRFVLDKSTISWIDKPSLSFH